MSVNEKMTAIADAIRWGTGRYDEKFGLDAMPQAIRDGIVDAENRGFHEGSLQGALSVREVHKITVAEDKAGSSQVAQWWIEDNDFVGKHHTDAGFSIQVISLQAHADGNALCYAYNGNRQMMALGENLVCGFRFSRTSSNSTNTAIATGNCIEGNTQGVPYVKPTERGVVSIHKAGGTALKAGDYLLILSVAGVE